MVACAVLTPAGVHNAAGSLGGLVMPGLVGLLSLSFAFSAWARAGLYCNHQVPSLTNKFQITSLIAQRYFERSPPANADMTHDT